GEFGEDPFLLAALSYRMGRCRPEAEEMNGIGLTSIPRQMYGDQLRRGSYRYWTREGGEWREQSVRVDRFPFAGPRLARPEENLYFAAAILSVWRRQHEDVDHAFEQVPHRHHVSHFVWGDRVRSDRAEDRILTDRRRMLQYYGSYAQPAPIVVRGGAMGVPLDGWPRVVSSYLGAERDGGERSHRGIDVESVLGEPVRALAGGRVNFAGVDLPGHRSSENMSNEALMAVPRGDLGAGGRYVCVLHDASPGWLRSCYMHLETVEVSWGQQVARGDRIGTVGRTGMRTSAPHLHLELHAPNELLDPSELLRGHLIGRRPEPEPRRRR
ncbi:MAG: M23 family metallopeptidase, partial [Myxococcales bacterium]|nr:M23 family metallopeptidase [Myxococcales bacterium]